VNRILGIISAILFILLFSMMVGGWLFSGFDMTSNAMEPTIKENGLIFINRFRVRARGPSRGEIVLLRVPGEEAQIIRRVIGLPGDRVELKGGILYINDIKKDEPYLKALENEPKLEGSEPIYFGPAHVPDGFCFVLGDNRLKSYDSRVFGMVRLGLVTGSVWVLWGTFVI